MGQGRPRSRRKIEWIHHWQRKLSGGPESYYPGTGCTVALPYCKLSSPRLMTVSVHAFVRDQHIMKLLKVASPSSNAFVLAVG